MPGTLSILTVTFPPQERAKAIGLWAGVSGIALALGPTLGGYMVEHIGWESVFFLNVPIGIVAFLVAMRTVTESRSEEARELDIPGLDPGDARPTVPHVRPDRGEPEGWSDPVIVGSLTASAVFLATFFWWEHRNPKAMMPLSFFRIPAFSAGNTVAFSVSLGMFSIFLFMSLYLQQIRGYTPFEAGVRFLPMTLMIIVTAPLAGKYAQRHGSKIPMTYGLLLMAVGLMALTQIQVDTPYSVIGVLFLIMGHGMGSTMAPDDRRCDELGRAAARGPRLGDDEHEPRGRRRARHRAARHDPVLQALGDDRAAARRTSVSRRRSRRRSPSSRGTAR